MNAFRLGRVSSNCLAALTMCSPTGQHLVISSTGFSWWSPTSLSDSTKGAWQVVSFCNTPSSTLPHIDNVVLLLLPPTTSTSSWQYHTTVSCFVRTTTTSTILCHYHRYQQRPRLALHSTSIKTQCGSNTPATIAIMIIYHVECPNTSL